MVEESKGNLYQGRKSKTNGKYVLNHEQHVILEILYAMVDNIKYVVSNWIIIIY